MQNAQPPKPLLAVVPDINVLVSSLINRHGPPGRIRAAWRRRKLVFIVSQIMIDKADEVLHRPHVFNAFLSPARAERRIQGLLRTLRQRTRLAPHALNLQVIKDDPEDNAILIAAVEGKADCIISGDRHLKALKTYEGIPILSPAEFVAQYNTP